MLTRHSNVDPPRLLNLVARDNTRNSEQTTLHIEANVSLLCLFKDYSGVLNVSPIHSRRYSFHVDDLDYDTACIVINNIVKTDLSLWMPGLSEDARRQVCVQCRSRCCNCGSTERILSWCRTSEART